MTQCWSKNDERRLSELQREYDGLLERRLSGAFPVAPHAQATRDTAPVERSPSNLRKVEPRLLARARQAYALTTKRRQLLGDKLFFNPGWNMLLDLFISEGSGRRLSVTAACIGSQSANATALRYASLLVDAGLAKRLADTTDGRRSYILLTDAGWSIMQQLLST